jgi:3-phenylpropionate/trans-cinnamate dioxygenase ferredoxin reductase subunit
MSSPGLVVIGSGPAGVSAAEAFRGLDQDRSVRILTADADPPYERPPLSKDYLRGETEDVTLHPAEWFRERNIELVHSSAVAEIDVAGRHVLAGGTSHPYSTLVIASGASPTPLPVPGGDLVLQLRSLADAARLRSACAAASSVTVIGAGFIGCEAAASLALQGISVTLVAPDDVPQEKRLGSAAGEQLLTLLKTAGVHYVGGATVKEVDRRGVTLDDGVTICSDVVLAATGVTPNSAVAAEVGLRVERSRIVVGSDMRTSIDGVFAAGDVTFAFNATAGRRLAVEHWQDAMDQGEVAGAGAAGGSASWDGVPGFWSTIGDTTVKYHAWGDGYQRSKLIARDDGFTVWYERDRAVVGVLTCNADDDYDLGETLIAEGRPAPVPLD